ncbi:MAG TPA: AI-2E family transporter [Candidatus Acidoferrales bacterium]|jgi:predicted PurR-regulated permease PerM|nr:AI-2E family transporter [Candidatus Acidoferrales bacterium]
MERKQRNRLILAGFATVVSVILVFISWPFRYVIAITLLLAFILQYPTAWLEKRIHRRRSAVLIVLASIFAALVFVLLDVIYVLYSEVTSLAVSSENLDVILNQGFERLIKNISTLISESLQLGSFQDRISQILSTILNNVLTTATDIIGRFIPSIPLYVVELIIITLLLYYLLLRGRDFIEETLSLVPPEYQREVNKFLRHLQSIYYSLFVVNLGSSLVSGILAAIGYAILGVPYFITFAILIAIFGLIPVIGRAIIYVPLTFYYLLIGDPLKAIVILVFSWAVLDQLTGLYILPLWAHRTGKVPQALTILAFTAPILALGPIGFIIGPAAYGLALALYRTYRDVRQDRDRSSEF